MVGVLLCRFFHHWIFPVFPDCLTLVVLHDYVFQHLCYRNSFICWSIYSTLKGYRLTFYKILFNNLRFHSPNNYCTLTEQFLYIIYFFILLKINVTFLFCLPLQGSFFMRNSSRAAQPPPTRTMTVERRIRTRRNFWESPNWNES